MSTLKHISLRALVPALFLFAVACVDGKDEPEESGSDAPVAISISPQSWNVDVSGGTLALSISAPSRPSIAGDPDWITVTDGPYNSATYKKTVTLNASANAEYTQRTATLTITADGVPGVTFAIVQDAAAEPVTPPAPDPGTNSAWQLSGQLGLGWNMGNHFDAFYNGTWAGDNFLMPDETCWGATPATQTTFDGVRKAGFTSVRIPITWLAKIGEAPDYKIDEAWLNRIYEVVGYAEKAGLNVIINTHHDENHHNITGPDGTDPRWQDVLGAANSSVMNEQIKAEVNSVWTQIAEKFKDKGDWLMFEAFNEINDGGWGWSSAFLANPSKQCGILNEWNQTFVDAVRATGGNNATRWLGVPTYAASPGFTDYLAIPSDPAGKTMVSVHFYDPFEYTIGEAQYTDWGHTGASGKKATWGDEDHVREVFGKLMQKYVDNDIPVYIGEFGCSMRSKSDTRAWKFYLYYLEYLVKAAKTYGMSCFLWDNGAQGDGQEHHGYLNHGTGDYIGNSKEAVDVMVKARFTTDASYTLDSVYKSAPTF